jgi:GNAT superfamily N-acetyltransferase
MAKTGIEIRSAGEIDPQALRDRVVERWGSEAVVAHDELMYPARLPGFVALSGDRVVGHVAYRIDGQACEVVSIEASSPHAGIGSQLMDRIIRTARDSGCRTVWLTTTNDNLDALRFYQRRGFRLRALREGATARARQTLKPELPALGSYGIPMCDELDLELELEAPGGSGSPAASRAGDR